MPEATAAPGSALWPDRWRLAAAGLGAGITAAAAFGLRDPLASMASYTAALMALNQLAPPLILLATPPSLARHRRALAVIFDPWIAIAAFVGLGIAVSLPGILNPTLANALYAGPLGLFELLAGILFWGQLLPATRQLRRPWKAALLAWAGSIPMTVVALVWMLAANVLYTPYIDVICRWNVPPLLDQKWAGFVMFLAGMPLQLAAAWLLLELGARPRSAPEAAHVALLRRSGLADFRAGATRCPPSGL
jgi:putative membrane protein